METEMAVRHMEVEAVLVVESLYITAEGSLTAFLRLLVVQVTWRTVPQEPCTWKKGEIAQSVRIAR